MELYPSALVSKALEQANGHIGSVSAPQKPQKDWREVARNINFAPTQQGSGPQISVLDRRLMASISPVHQNREIVKCPHCKRPLLALIATDHTSNCTTKPGRRSSLNGTRVVADATPATDSGANLSESDSRASVSVRKRKNEQPLRAKPVKRQKTKPKPKPAFNIDKQCGVLLPNGQQCARSLTCKAHSMGAKRAVLGRSVSYDVLLAQYQRQNLVKQASISTREAQAESDSDKEQLTPEKELQQVMEGVQATHYAPLDRKVLLPTRSRSQFRVREMLALAMLPKELNSSDAIFGRALAYCSDTPQQLQFVRSPAQRFMIQKALQRRKQLQMQQQQQQLQGQQGQSQQHQKR